MKEKIYSLKALKDFVRGFELSPVKEREVMLCITALNNKGIGIGDAVKFDDDVYLVGFRGFYTADLQILEFEKVGYEYIEENAERVNIKSIQNNDCYEDLVDALSMEYASLRKLYRQRCAPKDLDSATDREIINKRDKQLADLEDEYLKTLKNVDLLSSTLVKQVQENKKLQAKVNKK